MKWWKYQIFNGTGESGILFDKKIPYTPENEEIAKAEAYKGEYTMEDDGLPQQIPESSHNARITQLEQAMELLLSGVTE